jgi:predicted nucleic acid-binding protein
LLDETVRVLTEHFGCSIRFASLTKRRIARRSVFVEPRISRHQVPNDPDDSPIPAAALEAGADYLVSNDRHLLDLNPYEGLRIVSMSEYRAILIAEGFLRDI